MAPITFGALVYDYQAMDVMGPTDLLNSSSRHLLSALKVYAPMDETTISRAPEIVFHHIGLNRNPVALLSSHVTIVPTTTVDECPDLDCLILGGPNPDGFELHPKYADFIRRHVAAGKPLFTTCTGAYVAALSGVLDGKNATVNHIEFAWIKKRLPQVKWSMDKQWVVDGNIWTGSGASAGMDMIAHWIKENYGLDVLTAGALGLDYEPRDIDGLLTVLPKRYDGKGKQISTHVYKHYAEY
ncbi:class I glutamine amidotransferase-like protein [Xylaria bambusicola]|uniref:class I glutamine amidotransferase-like protein n=1 Tax=Xylaria bambusicola TaxID=326684 RepID=UPI0020075D2A|nr:class I glutamine amidotransferase-like protein [Xylaria bambusicola]KAI0505115.1 class I glutamine amidotransferase-like protein [Xylaria bambusicola]